jgi:hypothetical protein
MKPRIVTERQGVRVVTESRTDRYQLLGTTPAQRDTKSPRLWHLRINGHTPSVQTETLLNHESLRLFALERGGHLIAPLPQEAWERVLRAIYDQWCLPGKVVADEEIPF